MVASAVLVMACGSDSTGPEIDSTPVPNDTLQLPDTLTDGNDFVWDMYPQGYISNGSSDAYDGGMVLQIEGTSLGTIDSTAYVFSDSTEWWMPMDTTFEIAATRRLYVPADGTFARFLDILENPTASPIVADVTIFTNLGSDSATELIATSDTDTSFETGDTWIVTDDASNGGGDPTLVQVTQGPGASVPVTAVTFPTGTLSFSFSVPLAANGGRAILMHFAAQNANRTAAIANAGFISGLGPGTLDNISDEDLAAIINWDVAP